MMRNLRDSLHSRIAARLEAKKKADEQRSWRVSKAQDIQELRDRLSELTRGNAIEKKVEQASSDLRARTASLNLAFVTVIIDGEKKDGYSSPYDTICVARLPRGLGPHTVPSEELSASLGYILQLLNVAVPILSAPALHVPGFGASCSRIWQRSSYWSAKQSQRSYDYKLGGERQMLHNLAFTPSRPYAALGGMMCLRSDTLLKVMERLANPGVRRVFIVEAGSKRVEGIISLSDIFKFLLS